MTITNGYCTLAQLKGRLGIATADTDDDTELEKVIEGVCRFIDRDRRRVFYVSAAATRYYTPAHSDRLWVDDMTEITTVSVATNTARTYTDWAATDYDTEPLNELPIMALFVAPSSSRYFVPGLRKSVKIIGNFGYAATVPDEIEQAAILLAQYVWLRKDAPFGTAGFAALGEIALNPDLMPADVRGLINSVPRRVAQ